MESAKLYPLSRNRFAPQRRGVIHRQFYSTDRCRLRRHMSVRVICRIREGPDKGDEFRLGPMEKGTS